MVDGKGNSADNQIELIIQRLKGAAKVTSDNALADILGINRQNISHARKKNEVPPLWILKIGEKYDVSLDWLRFGTGAKKRGQAEAQPAEEVVEERREVRRRPAARAAEIERPINNKDMPEEREPERFKISSALSMAARVLESDTSYARALLMNVQHFDRAITSEERTRDFEKDVNKMKERIADLENQVRELRLASAEIHARIRAEDPPELRDELLKKRAISSA